MVGEEAGGEVEVGCRGSLGSVGSCYAMNYFETVDGLSRWFGYYCGWAARMLLVRGLSVHILHGLPHVVLCGYLSFRKLCVKSLFIVRFLLIFLVKPVNPYALSL